MKEQIVRIDNLGGGGVKMPDEYSQTFLYKLKEFFRKLVPHSIRSRVIYCFLIPVLLIYVTSSVIEINSRVAGLHEKMGLIVRETASEMAHRILARSLSVSTSVVTLADSYSLASDESYAREIGSDKSVYEMIERVLNKNDVIVYGAGIALEPDADGKRYYKYVKTNAADNASSRSDFSDTKDIDGHLYTESEWYKTLKDDYVKIFSGRKGILSTPFINNENQLLMHYLSPIVRNGKFTGVVITDISFNILRSELRKHLLQSNRDDIVLRILDPYGHFCMVSFGEDALTTGPTLLEIAKEQNNKPLAEIVEQVFAGMQNNEAVSVICRDFTGGKDVMAAFAPITGRLSNWTLMVTVPADSVDGPIAEQIRRSVVFTIFFTLTIAIIGFAISHSISHSLRKLIYFADELRKGKYHTKFQGKVFDKKDEIGGLARSFKLMARAVVGRRKKFEHMQVVLIHALSSLAEYRDPETGNHIKRTALYAELLTDEAKRRSLLDTNIVLRQHTDVSVSKIIARAAPLHDIGKIGIPDSVLLKPDKLTKEEFETMKFHVNYGIKALRMVIHELGEQSFLNLALDICAGHHERYDGKGYPNGLHGEDIPFVGRIMAIADVYDALTTERPYKAAFDHDTAVGIIKEGAGTQFDPQLTECFLAVSEQFAEIAKNYKEEEKRFLDSAVR